MCHAVSMQVWLIALFVRAGGRFGVARIPAVREFVVIFMIRDMTPHHSIFLGSRA